MQAVLDFLLQYFYWILGVLVMLLITVIGFLADTKRKKKLREKNNSGNASTENVDLNNMNMGGMNMNNEVNNVNEMNNNMMNQNMTAMPNMGMNDLNNVTPDMNAGVNNVNVVPEAPAVNNFSNINEVPEAPVESAPSNDSFFTPASEQTPTFAPRDVTVPTPVEPTPIMNNGAPSVNSWDMQANSNVSPVGVAPEVQPSVQPFGGETPASSEVNPAVNFGNVSAPVTPVVPEAPVVPEVSANVNVMPEMPTTNVMPQVEPVVNPQMDNPAVNFGPSMNVVQDGQVPPASAPVTPNFVTGVPQQNNVMNNNMNNLNG